MNSIEQVLGAYGRFEYNSDKKKSDVELSEEFDKLLGTKENDAVATQRTTVSDAENSAPETIPAGPGIVLYLYNFLGETRIMKQYSGANVNKLV